MVTDDMTPTAPVVINYREEYNQLETAIKSGPIEEFPIFFEGVTSALESLLNGTLQPESHGKYFKLTSLPKIVLYILSRSDFHENEDLQKEVQSFLQRVLVYCISQIEEDQRELHAAVARILTPAMGFYILPENQSPPTLQLKKQHFAQSSWDKEYTEFRKADPPISVLYYMNIECFANHGGFTKILNRFEHVEEKNLSLLKHMLSPLLQCREYLRDEFLEVHVPEVAKFVFGKLLSSNSGPLIKNEKLLTGDIVASIRSLLLMILPQEQVLQDIDRFKLDFGVRGFDSENLERRLRSLTIITSAVERAMPSKEEKDRNILQFLRRAGIPTRQNQQEEEKKEKPKPLSPSFIINWLEESEFIPQLLDRKAHPEIIKQGILILRFLAVNKLLQDEHIDTIWAMQEGKHESVKNTIFDSLVLLAEDLSVKQIHHIQEYVDAIQDKEHDFETLRFISQFSPLCIEKDSSPSAWLGLETLYRLSMASMEEINESVVTGAFDHLVKLLKLNAAAPRRVYFIEKAMSNLAKYQSVLPSLRLIQETLKYFSQRKRKNPIQRKEPTRKSIIENLNQSHNIIDLVLDDLSKYKQSVSDLPSKKLRKSKKLVAGCSHLENIRIRLSFLDFVLTNSSLLMLSKHVDSLWDSIVVNGLISEEKTIGYQWFESALRNNVSLEDSAAHHLFETQMKKMDSKRLSEAGYSVFEHYFLYLNEKHGHIRAISKSDFAVSNQLERELMGNENMWSIALDSKDPQISEKAIKCLNMLHQNIPSDSQKQRFVMLREQYISRCLDYLEEAISIEPPNLSRVDCCIRVLTLLVYDYEAKVHQEEGAGEVTVTVRVDKGSNFSVTLRSTDTIKTLRHEVADKYGRPMNSIRVFLGNTELKGDKTLKEAKITNDTQLLARAKVTDNTKPISEEDRFIEYVQEITIRSWLTQILELQLNGFGIRSDQIQNLLHTTSQSSHGLTEQENLAVRIMGQQKNFQRLFKLLNLQGDIAGRAWDLLNILPPNSAMIEDFAQVDTLEQNLSSYLDPAVILKLAYTLNMISILVERQQDEDSQWCDMFLKLNGIYRLLDTLLDIPVADSSAHITCFNQLLCLVNYFIEYQAHTQKNLGNDIHEYPRLQEAFTRVLSISYTLTMGQQTCIDRKNIIVGHCIRFVSKVVQANHALLEELYSWDLLSEWLRCSLLQCPSSPIRQEASKELIRLCREIEANCNEEDIKEAPSSFFINLLLSFLPLIGKYPKTSDCYFWGLEQIIQNSQRATKHPESTKKLVVQLVGTLKDHRVLEATENAKDKDTGLIGLLDLIRTLIRDSPALKNVASAKGLLAELFTNCLFAIPSADNHGPDAPPKCKTRDSRYAAYRLLVELCRDVPSNFSTLFTALLKNTKNINHRNNWQITPAAKDKASHGYVGLENLGATCYMNSLMQQLYIMPEFRGSILSVTDKSEDPDDSPLYQLQYMFAYLQETLKGSYSPTPFTASYKDWEGNPVNTRVQMDANEFFNTLFDKLEGLLAPTERPHLLKEIFGGVLSNQIISQECEHVSENTEDFYTVGVAMKNKKDIYSSLDSFIEGEMLEGYHCDLCDKKVNALKRCCLKTLPKTLLIQLKRFEFDLQTMRNRKLNDECAFPMELNVEPYTVEGIAKKEAEEDIRKSQALRASLSAQVPKPPEYYQYQLSGVVVHTGTADGGHYYSFIKERTPLHEGDECKWFEFNDSCVEKWDIKDLAKECFGGKQTFLQRDRQTGQVSQVERDILKNAYILVYERISAITDEDEHDGDHLLHSDESAIPLQSPKEEMKKEEAPETDIVPIQAQVPIPEDIMKKIWKENREFIVEKHIFDKNYFNFVWRLINLYTTPEYLQQQDAVQPIMQAVELATRFAVEIYARARENQLFPMWFKHLKNVYSSYPIACIWLLKTLVAKTPLIKSMLLYCPMERTRAGFASLIEQSFLTLRDNEKEHYIAQYEAIKDCKIREVPPQDVKSWSVMLIESLFSLIKDARNPKYSNTQYFVVFQNFWDIGMEEREYLEHRELLLKIIDFIMGSGVFAERADLSTKESRLQAYMKGATPKGTFGSGPLNVGSAIEAMHTVLLGMVTPEQQEKWKENIPPTVDPEKGFKLILLKEEEQNAIFSQALWKKVLRECYRERIVSSLLTHLCWEDQKALEFFIETLKDAFENCVMQSHAKQYLRAVLVLQEMGDSLRSKRISLTCALIIEAIDFALTNKNKELSRLHASWINTRRTKNQDVKQWCSKNSKKINPILSRVPPPSPPIKR